VYGLHLPESLFMVLEQKQRFHVFDRG
jgi:hypothetical protein